MTVATAAAGLVEHVAEGYDANCEHGWFQSLLLIGVMLQRDYLPSGWSDWYQCDVTEEDMQLPARLVHVSVAGQDPNGRGAIQRQGDANKGGRPRNGQPSTRWPVIRVRPAAYDAITAEAERRGVRRGDVVDGLVPDDAGEAP